MLALFTARAAIAGDAPTSSADPFLDNLPTVEAAALHTQTLYEAPANVSVITKAEIRTYGYRTLGEALASVRGFYMTYDHIYSSAGVRGFSLPGDFNTRFLVMINGHPMTENIFASNNFFDQDFGLDMDLVEKIEIIRGPSSALYGSNGIFATINVVTISPVDFAGGYGSAEAGSFGEKKAVAAGSYYLGKGANLLLSASVVNDAGQSLYFPQLDTPEFGGGHAINMDGQRAYHTFANLVWHGWNISSYFNARDKSAPLAWDFDANSLLSRGNHVIDSRNFVSAVYSRALGAGQLRWQLSYDNYRYADRFDFPSDAGIVTHDSYADANWLTSRVTDQFPAGMLGVLTAGVEASADLQNLQYNTVGAPQAVTALWIERPGRSVAVFVEQEKRLTAHWKLDLGVRLDDFRYYGHFISPRAVLAYQSSPRTVYKFIYGRPFRNPSPFEQFYYDDISYFPAAPLKAESAETVEVSAEHHFGSKISGSVSAYDYRLANLIQAVYSSDNLDSQFSNLDGSRSRGVELELGGKLWPWLDLNGSFSWQDAREQGSSVPFPNSPARLAKLRWAIPVNRRITFSSTLQAMSSRQTAGGDPVRPLLLAGFTVTVRHIASGCDLLAGVRNALNWAYQDPIGLSLETIRGDPRSAFVKLVWTSAR